MKILFMSDLLSYGGASKLLYDLMPLLKKRGHQCSLLILTDKQSKYVDDLAADGIRVDVVPKDVQGHFAKIKYISQYIKAGSYDVIHANLFPMLYYCALVKRVLGKKCPPIVMTEHSTDNKRRHKSFLRPLEQFIYDSYDHVISISNQAQDSLLAWLKKTTAEGYSVIENGIHLDKFVNAEPHRKTDLFDQYQEGDLLIGLVGSFTPQKNHINMIEAMSKLPEQYKLVLAGEGPLMDTIKSKVDQLNLNERVVFLGFRRDMAELMHTIDILVIPSVWEGFGLVAAEAMACGAAVVASDVPGLSDVVADCGLKCDPKDSDDIAKKILLLQDADLVRELKQKGNNRARRFDIERTATSYETVLHSVSKK